MQRLKHLLRRSTLCSGDDTPIEHLEAIKSFTDAFEKLGMRFQHFVAQYTIATYIMHAMQTSLLHAVWVQLHCASCGMTDADITVGKTYPEVWKTTSDVGLHQNLLGKGIVLQSQLLQCSQHSDSINLCVARSLLVRLLGFLAL